MYRCLSNPHCQLAYRLAHGLIKVDQSFPVHSPAKRCTDLGAVQPDFNVILLIGHCVLGERV